MAHIAPLPAHRNAADRAHHPSARRVGRATLLGRLLAIVAILGFVVTWVFLFMPASLGGSTSYVIVSGHSMEPTLRTGDLAIVRAQASYEVGDLIAFRAEGGEVIHRIVGGNANDGFVVQGDNNPSPDIWRPKPDEIAGTRWLSVPEGGRWVVFFRQPTNFAILMATLTVLVLLGNGQLKHQSRKESHRSVAAART